jgi:hypothetical protein
MNKLHILSIIGAAGLIFSSCEKKVDPVPIDTSSYSETETYIRSAYDGMAVFTWSDYSRLMLKLSETKFAVMPINDMRNYVDNSKVVVGLRHDIDHNPFKGLEMANIEKSYGFRATYYILATEEYYGRFSSTGIIRNKGMGSLYRKIYDTGAEIGIHNDLLAVMILYNLDPVEFNKDELSFYNSLGIPIYGTASHGSNIAKATVPNYQIFSDFALSDSVSYLGKKYKIGLQSLRDFGFRYEAYFFNYDKNLYCSDSGGRWNDPEGLDGILKRLDSSKPGDRIVILAHPDWWGRPDYKLKTDSIPGGL